MTSAAILAGGQARRFDGRDKSALVVDGRTILDRQLDALTPIASDILLVGGTSASPRVRVVADAVPGCGPLGGLHTALLESAGDHVLLLACDMPFVTTPFLEHLASLAGTADIVMPETERGPHPLCAVYAKTCLDAVARRLADRRLRLRELAGDLRVRVVPADEIDRFGNRHRLLANVNTPADFAGLEALQGHKL